MGEWGGGALAQFEMRLAARRRVAVRVGPPVGECRGVRDLYLLPAKAFPLAVAELGEARVAPPLGRIEAELAADDLRCLAHAAERASEEDRGPRRARELGIERAAHGERLPAAALGQRRILGALHAPLGIPRGLAVAQHVDRGGKRQDACLRITILAAP